MSCAYNKTEDWRLGRAGVTSLEFAIVASLFFMALFSCMDLGRYYLIEHSLRTMVAEAARAAQADPTLLLSGNGPFLQNFAKAAPLVNDDNLSLTVLQSSAVTPGPITITVQGAYPFRAILWAALNGQIQDSTQLSY